VKVKGGVRASFMAIATVAAVFMLGACSTAPPADPGPPKIPTCPAPNGNWAVGDSLGNELNAYPAVPGWPDSGTYSGQWANFSKPGAGAINRAAFIEINLGYCTADQMPSVVVLEAGINDLAFGSQSTAMLESTISNFIKTVGPTVPVRVVAITPLNSVSPQIPTVEPEREAYNAWLNSTYPNIAIDCNSLLAASNGFLRPEYALPNDTLVHLNQTGENVLGNCIGAAAL
jgi:hypothetical protein